MTTVNTKNTHFKLSLLLPYVSVLIISSLLCIGFCKFVIHKETDDDIVTTKSIAASMLLTEKYIDNNLKSSLVALNYYIDLKGMPKDGNQLTNFMRDTGIDLGALTIYSAKSGKIDYATGSDSGWINKDWAEGQRKNYFKKYSVFDACDVTMEEQMISGKKDAFSVWPIKRQNNPDRNSAYNYAIVGAYFVDKPNYLFYSFNQTDDMAIAIQNEIGNSAIKRIVVTSPSGHVLMDSSELETTTDKKFGKVQNEYSKIPQVESSFSSVTISIPFGKLHNSCGMKIGDNSHYSGTANEKGQYFYVMNVIFDKTALNQQLAMIIAGFIVSTLFVFVAIYYVSKSMHQSNELSELSERTADKVTHLCNARLGEIRRYVTKIAKDSMRVNNMNKELPEEMVQLLNRAFREVEEKDLVKIDPETESKGEKVTETE